MTPRKPKTDDATDVSRRFVVRSAYPINIGGLRAADGGILPLLADGDVIEVEELSDGWECPVWLEPTDAEPTVLSVAVRLATEAVEPVEAPDDASTPDGGGTPPSDSQDPATPPVDPAL